MLVESLETVDALLRHRVAEDPERQLYVFLEDGEREGAVWSRADLLRRARAVGAALQGQGLRKGDGALLVFPQGLDFVAALVGCMLIGVHGVPAPTPDLARLARTVPRLASIARDAEAKAVVAHSALDALGQVLPPELPGVGWVVADTLPDELAADCVELEAAPGDVAWLQYTSGSTSDPKGVMVTHENLMRHARLVQGWHPLTPDDTIVSWLPEFHDFGLVYGVIQPIWVGCRSVLLSPQAFIQRPIRWLEAITKYRGSISPTPNFGLELCAQKSTPEERARLDLSTWYSFSGSEPIRQDTERRFLQVFGSCGFSPRQVLHAYGMAESTLVLSGDRVGDSGRFVTIDPDAYERDEVVLLPEGSPNGVVVASCGPPIPEVDIRAVDPITRRDVGALRVGELWVHGPNVCAGYWRAADATRDTFGGELEPSDGRAWLRTGDLGFVHEGQIYVSGRLKDLIIVHGANKHPQDLEWAIQAMHPAFRQNCGAAFGHYVDGEERLCFVSEVRPELVDDVEAIWAAVREVAGVHGLLVWRVALIPPKALPKTSSGKIQRRRTRDLLFGDQLPILAEWKAGVRGPGREVDDLLEQMRLRPKRARALLVDRVRARVAAMVGVDPSVILADRPLREQGLDSIGVVDVVEWLERETQTELGVGVAHEAPDLHALADLVVRRTVRAP
ncbi:MAG: AMP-binding protein [Alphaproteobacteria bacterium]|nr:AMP-binding protein [Alphaproteobacteria bacterium]